MPARPSRRNGAASESTAPDARARAGRTRRASTSTRAAGRDGGDAAGGLAHLPGRWAGVASTAQGWLARLGPFAPAAVAMATRYARRHPLRSVLIAGALYYVGRRWWRPALDTAAAR